MQLLPQKDYVSLTLEFRCNLKCVHCMIEGTMDELRPLPDSHFDDVLTHNRQHKQWQGLILTGSEITLRKDLPALAERARAAGFERVRIQTHGMHLGQPSYCDRLLDAGVNEFFVSVAGHDAGSHDEITQVPGAFDKMLRGMEYLDSKPGVSLITNTVVTQLSYRLLPELVQNLRHLRQLRQMEFWCYWPMAEHDEKQLIVRHADALPFLLQATRQAEALGRVVEIKNFPACLLGDLQDRVVNSQPELHIDPKFWQEFDRNGFGECVHRDDCAHTECLGLNTAYTARFGWEQEQLSPVLVPMRWVN